jgi:hypothetical protein
MRYVLRHLTPTGGSLLKVFAARVSALVLMGIHMPWIVI